jgi:predicted ABC-type ATPase
MPATPVLFVLAGVNGAGKSSIGGAWLRAQKMPFYNPDEAAQRIRDALDCTPEQANSLAWKEGKRRLEEAIASRSSHALETTLGEKTMTGLLEAAATSGFDVMVWFVGHDIS